MIIACGKKGDPKYNESQNQTELQNILTNKT